jgi:hypothetical protein
LLLKNFKGAHRSFPFIIALDGEREIEVNWPGQLELTLGLDGQKVVSIPRILREASKKGFFRTGGKWRKGEGRGVKS